MDLMGSCGTDWSGLACCRVLGDNNENLGKIVAVLVKCLSKSSDGKDGLVEPETYRKIVTLLRQMQSSLPAPVSLRSHLLSLCYILTSCPQR